MDRKRLLPFGLLSGLVWIGFAAAAPPRQKPTADQAAFFETKIRPVLVANCNGCHGSGLQLANLRVDSLAAILKGGDSGPALVPGEPDKSLLIQAVRQTGALKMPKGGKLKPEEVADLEAWVKMGAPWPDASTKKPDALWSLQPVKNPAIPKVKGIARVRNPIDAFILAKLEAKAQTLAPEADPRTLLRRLSYDLTGLPPSPEEMDAFLADKAPAAYEKAVDRLLASPRYGERWARIWLDVARYADTKGYVFEEDRNYYNAYTYRDWVINAFNRDLPYDQFITQQLAADRLPEVQNGDDKTALAALGFLTIGRRFLNNAPDIIDDRIDVTMRGLQAFTVACARCHDHKFDPIPTQDYYSLYAVFNSSVETEAPISPKPIRDPWIDYNKKVTTLESEIRRISVAQVKRLRQMRQDPGLEKSLTEEVKTTLQALREETVAQGEVLAKLAKAFEPAERDRLQQIQDERAALERGAPEKPEIAMAMVDRSDPSDGVVFKRGNPGSPGEPAPRRFLLALSKPDTERPHWVEGSGRLDLAKAIASRANPLTARVFVNRVWQNHFGAGLVRTPSDFGHQGERPTHPELLDYLATAFMDGGWSIKKLQKLIVTSATYRQSSMATAAGFNADPENRLLGHQSRHRLDLEQMRDSILWAAGRLDVAKVGGKSIELWAQPFSTRRTLYGFVDRQNLPGVFRTFDFASPDSTSSRRFLTTVPQQGLFFMNSPFSIEQARALANRPEIRSSQDDAQRVRRLYRLLFDRLPDASELAAGTAYLKANALQTMAAPESYWSYGYGGYDPAQKGTSNFTALNLISNQYRPGPAFPDPVLGYMVLAANGGHPGHDAMHAVIRRWTAPVATTIRVSGLLGHAQTQGDGVRARVISSRLGLVGEWSAHNGSAKTEVASIAVQPGDTIDFAVDPIANDGFDAYSWSLNVTTLDGTKSWNDTERFGRPVAPQLNRLTLYAQALMMTNEFLFVD